MIEAIIDKTPLKEVWKRVGIHPHHGINIPLSSLKTHTSSGIGEFYDLIPLIDWIQAVGMDVIQLLPLNDTGEDASPYNALSSMALDPIYLTLDVLPHLESYPELKRKLKGFKRLNQLKKVAFLEVKKEKEAFLREYFTLAYDEFHHEPEFKRFQAQYEWLAPYALFKAIRKEERNQPWMKWPEEKRKISPQNLFHWLYEYDEEVKFHMLMQYLTFEQMLAVKNYAAEKGVLLKGDIPILVNRGSADVWFYRENFSLDLSAGCPPDMFNSEGQNWGFPLFHWDYMIKNHYHWWRQRLSYASNFYHLYRLDHLVGFFRIWAVPKGKKAKEGHYISRNRHIWPFHAEERLRAIISASQMLPMGEDLGTVPFEVKPTLKKLGITGTKVIRWERYWNEDGSFISLDAYDPVSLTTTGTHDIETLGEWWEMYPLEAKEYARSRSMKYQKNCTPDLRYQLLKDSHETSSLFHINLFSEYIAGFSDLSFDTFKEDRINTAGTISSSNWTYRLKEPLDKIIHHQGLSEWMASFAYKPTKREEEVYD